MTKTKIISKYPTNNCVPEFANLLNMTFKKIPQEIYEKLFRQILSTVVNSSQFRIETNLSSTLKSV